MASIALQLENGQLNIAPGETGVVGITLTNTGGVVDAFTITVMGLDPAWYTLSTGEARLFPRQAAAVTLQVHPPTTDARPVAGFYPFTVMALSRDNPTEQALGQGMVNLSAVGGLALDLQPRTISGRQGLFAITLSNAANAPRPTVLAISDPEEALQFTLGTPYVRQGEVSQADVFAAPTNTGYTDSSYVTPPAFGTKSAEGKGILEQELELPPGSSMVVPVMVKPQKRVWTGKERPFPFTAGVHPPGVEWEASEAQTVEAKLAYRPIFAAWTGAPIALRRALLIAIPLLVLACLLFLLLRPQDNAGVTAVQQTQTAVALSAQQTQTALAASIAQTMTAVALANGGNAEAANATLTALAGGNPQTQTAIAAAAQTALAGANASATALAGGAGAGGEGSANIDKFYLKLGDPNATATPIGGGLAGSETSLQYDVTGAQAVRINQSSRPIQIAGLANASVIDFRMVATGTNQLAVTRTLSVLVVRPPVIASFDGAPLTIGPGDSTSLLWEILGAKDVTIDGIPVTATGTDGKGQIGVQPTGTRRFIICASNAVGQVCKSVMVTVLPPGAPTPTTPPPPTAVPPTRVPNTRVPNTRVPNTAVPTTAVPIVTATTCPIDYIVTEEREATVTAGTTQVPNLQCDDCASTVLLPFPFQLYDRVFDRVSIGSNGTLNFAATTSPSATNACLPAPSGFDHAIFPHWDNLSTNGANLGVFTSVTGDAPNRIFYIEWRARLVTGTQPNVSATATPANSINFQVVLYENAPDQRFDVVYGKLAGGGTGATIGVQRDTGSTDTQYSCNTSGRISEGLRLIFTLPCGSGVGDQPLTCAPAEKIITIVNGSFSPRNVIVAQGSTVIWVNQDDDTHSTDDVGTVWSSGPLAEGDAFRVVLDTPGAYYYRSALDRTVTGNIIVLPPCVVTPTPSGTSTGTATSTGTPIRNVTGTATRTSTRVITGTPPSNTPTLTGTPPTLTPTGVTTGTVTGTVTGTATGVISVTRTVIVTGTTTSVTGTPTASTGSRTSTATPGFGDPSCSTISTTTGSIKEGDATQRGRVGLYNAPSRCTSSQPCLPPPDTLLRHYDSYSFSNDLDTEVCISVAIQASGCVGAGVMSVAYLGAYDPTNLCLNYLGQGGPPQSQYIYSFTVPARSTYIVVVHEYAPNQGCDAYTISVAVCSPFTPTPVPPGPTNPPPPQSTNPPPPQVSATRTNTRPPSSTPVSPSATRTATRVITSTATSTRVLTNTATATSVLTNTATSTITITNTPTATATVTCVAGQDYIYTVSANATLVPANNLVLNNCDDCATAVALPFPVTFYGQTYFTATLGSNGTLGFVANSNPFTSSCLPSSTAFDAAILPSWQDYVLGVPGTVVPKPLAYNGGENDIALTPSQGSKSDYDPATLPSSVGVPGRVPGLQSPLFQVTSGISTSTVGAAPNRIFVIQWQAHPIDNPSITDRFEIILYETPPLPQQIDVIYGSMFNGGNGATIGVQKDVGSRFTQVTCDASGTAPGTRITFYLPPCAQTVTPTPTSPISTSTATPIVTSTSTVTGTATATPTAAGEICGPDSNYQVNAGMLPLISATTPVPDISPCLTIDCRGIVIFPFPVRFYDIIALSAVVGDNGTLVLTTSPDPNPDINPNPSTNSCLPAGVPPIAYAIFPFWDALTMTASGQGVFTEVIGSSPNRTLIIQWLGVNGLGQSVNFEVKLYETPGAGRYSQFDVVYGSVPTTPDVTIGVQKDGVLYTEVACNEAFGTIGRTFFQAACPTATPTATSSSIATSTTTPTIPGPPSSTITPTPTSTSLPTLGPLQAEACRQWINDESPVSLQADGTIESDLVLPMDGVVASLSVSNLSIVKEGAGKLNGYLVAPDGTEVPLFYWVCRSPDSGDQFRWLNVTLSGEAGRGISGVYCNSSVRGGLFRPEGVVQPAFSELRGVAVAGTWKLRLKADPSEVDSVRLESWGLNICATASTRPANYIVADTQGTPGSGLDLIFAILAAALATIGAPLALSRSRGVLFLEE